MATTVAEVMTLDPAIVNPDTPVSEAARQMRARNTGDVLIVDGDRLAGIITDRDITVRVVAENKGPQHTGARSLRLRGADHRHS